MEKEALKRIFSFLEEKEKKSHKDKGTLLWKIVFNEPLTKEDLNVKGDLNLRMKNITSLPKGLKVGGNLSLYDSNITSLPEGLEVGGNLDLSYTKTTSLPKGFKVGRDLLLFGCEQITSLPEGLKVGGGLNLAYCDNITSLPESLYVDGDLNIRYTPLKKYTDDELREMVKPGFIKGKIHR